MKLPKDEFYVGYFEKAPTQTARLVRNLVIILGVLTCIVAFTLAWNQKPFSYSQFEYGKTTTVEGYFSTDPIPHLVLPFGVSEGQELFQNVLLVGVGKAGPGNVIARLEKNAGKSLAGLRLRLNGTLIYGEGRALLQIAEEDNASAIPEDAPALPKEQWTSFGSLNISGEIVDPKCFFGVMKPGEGKAHRSCAVRCIAGGIPAIFHAETGEYYLLVNEDSEPMRQEVLSLVGDNISLSGESITWNDWKLLKVSTKLMQEMSDQKSWKEKLTAFENGITQCSRY